MADANGETKPNVPDSKEPLPGEARDHPGNETFREIVRRFEGNLEHLRDFVQSIDLFLDSEEEKTHEAKAAIDSLMAKLGPFLEEAHEGKASAKEQRVKVDLSHQVRELLEHTNKLARPIVHRSHLYSTSLVSLASAAEIFFGNLLNAYYTRVPEAADLKDSVLTFKDLTRFETVLDARAFLLENRIEQILRLRFRPFQAS